MGVIASTFTPTAGATLGTTSQVDIHVTNTDPVTVFQVLVYYPTLDYMEVANFLGTFHAPYAASSSYSSDATNIYVTLIRDGGWPEAPTARLIVADSVGGTNTDSSAYLLTAPAYVPPIPSPYSLLAPPPNFPANGGGTDCDAVSYDQQHFLDMLDRVYPLEYLAPLKTNTNSGYEVYQQAAAVFARASLAAERLECGSFAIYATGGAFATGYVEFYRSSATAGAVTVKAGTIVTTLSGRDFVTTQDVSFGALAVDAVYAPVRAVSYGYEWNFAAPTTTASGILLEGPVHIVKSLYTSPEYGDPTIEVRQTTAMTGGVSADLDAIGDDRDLPRRVGEDDLAYRLRIRTLPDTVSPGAVVRLAETLLNPLGIEFAFIETFDIAYQTCWDAPSPNVGTPSYLTPPYPNPNYDSNLFVFDDPRGTWPFRNMWLDELEMRGAFIIVMKLTPLLDFGFALDDPGTTPADFKSGSRQRGTSAFDLLSTMPSDQVFPAAFDGYDVQFDGRRASLFQQLQKIKAGGVAALVEIGIP